MINQAAQAGYNSYAQQPVQAAQIAQLQGSASPYGLATQAGQSSGGPSMYGNSANSYASSAANSYGLAPPSAAQAPMQQAASQLGPSQAGQWSGGSGMSGNSSSQNSSQYPAGTFQAIGPPGLTQQAQGLYNASAGASAQSPDFWKAQLGSSFDQNAWDRANGGGASQQASPQRAMSQDNANSYGLASQGPAQYAPSAAIGPMRAGQSTGAGMYGNSMSMRPAAPMPSFSPMRQAMASHASLFRPGPRNAPLNMMRRR